MRIASWNMAYWSHGTTHEEAWRWVLSELKPDIFLFQEAVVPAWVRNELHVVWQPAYPASSQAWGTGIATRLPCRPARLGELDAWFEMVPASVDGSRLARINRADGWLASAHIETPALGDILLASVHSPAFPIEKSRIEGIDVSAMKSKKNPDLWFLDLLFHFARARLGSNLLIGGDFNYSRLLDESCDSGNNDFFDQIASDGFVSLHRMFHDRDEQTFFAEGRRAHQLDYIYADARVAERFHACHVSPVQPFSDHAPLIADGVFEREVVA